MKKLNTLFVALIMLTFSSISNAEMKFGVSDGMVLATSDKEDIFLISPLKNVTPGSKIS